MKSNKNIFTLSSVVTFFASSFLFLISLKKHGRTFLSNLADIRSLRREVLFAYGPYSQAWEDDIASEIMMGAEKIQTVRNRSQIVSAGGQELIDLFGQDYVNPKVFNRGKYSICMAMAISCLRQAALLCNMTGFPSKGLCLTSTADSLHILHIGLIRGVKIPTQVCSPELVQENISAMQVVYGEEESELYYHDVLIMIAEKLQNTEALPWYCHQYVRAGEFYALKASSEASEIVEQLLASSQELLIPKSINPTDPKLSK